MKSKKATPKLPKSSVMNMPKGKKMAMKSKKAC